MGIKPYQCNLCEKVSSLFWSNQKKKQIQSFTGRDLLDQHFRRGPHRDTDLKVLWATAAILPEKHKQVDKWVELLLKIKVSFEAMFFPWIVYIRS